MDCGGGTKFLLTATNRRTWNSLKLHALLEDIVQLKSEQKGIMGIFMTFHLLPTIFFACNEINAHI